MHLLPFIRIWIWPALLLCTATAHAEIVEPDLAITPSRLPQRLDESPSAITVIDREMLRASGVRRIADILRLVPGMVVGSRSPAVQPATYLGLSDDLSRRVQVLVDGFSIYTPSTGSVLWQDLPIAVEDIERIEVVRGPNTAAYGSHAFLATIKITTIAPREAASWGVSGAVGSNGVRDGHAQLAAGSDLGALLLSYRHQEDDGMAGRDYRGGHRVDAVRLKGEADLAPGIDMQWQLGLARARNGVDDQVPTDVSATINDVFRDDNDHQFVVFRHHPVSGNEWVLRLARNAQHYQEPDAMRYDWIYRPGEVPTSMEPLTLGRGFDATRYDAELEHHLAPVGALRAVWGVGLRREEVVGERFFGTSDTQRQDSARLFGHGEWRLAPDWLLNGGAMVEDSSISERVFTPRLALIHHLAPGHTVRAGWSTGTRQPLLFENQGRTAAWDMGGNPIWLTRATGTEHGGLEPERATEWSLGYLWKPSRNLQLDLRAYHLQVDNLIRALIRTSGSDTVVWYPFTPSGITPGMPAVLDMQNGGAITVQGLEAQLDTRLSRSLSMHLNYALTEADDDQPPAMGWPDYAASVPRHTAGLLLTQQLGSAWDASLRLHYTSPMQWGFFTRDALDATTSVSARVGYMHRMGSQRVRLDLIGENLDGTVRDFDRERGWGRTVWLRLGMDAL